MATLDAIFSPRSVAVVGASTKPGKVGRHFRQYSRRRISGCPLSSQSHGQGDTVRQGLPRLSDVPDPVDLAIIILPPGSP